VEVYYYIISSVRLIALMHQLYFIVLITRGQSIGKGCVEHALTKGKSGSCLGWGRHCWVLKAQILDGCPDPFTARGREWGNVGNVARCTVFTFARWRHFQCSHCKITLASCYCIILPFAGIFQRRGGVCAKQGGTATVC